MAEAADLGCLCHFVVQNLLNLFHPDFRHSFVGIFYCKKFHDLISPTDLIEFILDLICDDLGRFFFSKFLT